MYLASLLTKLKAKLAKNHPPEIAIFAGAGCPARAIN